MPDIIFKDVEIHSISRLPSSENGNPRFKLHTDQGDFATKPDASLNYAVENLTSSRFPEEHLIGNPGVKVNLIGGSRNSIYQIGRAK